MSKFKKTAAAVSALAILFTTLTVPTVSAAESTTEDIGGGWTVTYANGTEKDDTHFAKITDKVARSGNHSLHINCPDGGIDAARIAIEHPCGSTYGEWGEENKFRVQFYIKGGYDEWCTQVGPFNCTDNTNHGSFLRIWYNTKRGQKVVIEEPDENGWRKVYFDYVYPYDDTAKSGFKIHIYGSTSDVYIDDISVTYNGTNEARKGVQLLFNGGFESEELSDYGWTYTGTSGYGAAEIANENGNKMLHIRYSKEIYAEDFVLTKTIATSPENIDWAKYKIYFKAKGNFFDTSIEIGNDKYWEVSCIGKPQKIKDLDDGWALYSVQAKGKNETSKIRIAVHGYCYDMYLDDFAIVKLKEVKNDDETITYTDDNGDHLENGTFDNPTGKLNLQPDNWYFVSQPQNDARFFITRDTTRSKSGKNSMYIGAPGDYVAEKYVDMRQSLPEDFDYTKEYTFKVKMYTPTPNTVLRAEFSNVSNSVGCEKVLNSAYAEHLGDSWYQYTVPMQAKAGYNQLRICAMNAVGGIWIDDVSLTDSDGKEYVVNGSFDEYTRYEVGEFSLMNESYEDINALAAGELTIENTFKPLEDGLKCAMYFAIYKNNKLYDIIKGQASDELTTGADTTYSATVTLDSVSDGVYTAKAFMWDPDTMTPYCTNGKW